jgi:hypothetical protein
VEPGRAGQERPVALEYPNWEKGVGAHARRGAGRVGSGPEREAGRAGRAREHDPHVRQYHRRWRTRSGTAGRCAGSAGPRTAAPCAPRVPTG